MEKVKVSQTVANLIESKKTSYDVRHKQHCQLREVMKDHANLLGKMDIDIVTLAKAIQYGYEVEYEFKLHDVLLNKSTGIPFIVNEDIHNRGYVNENKERYILLCKAENREDLKEVSNG